MCGSENNNYHVTLEVKDTNNNSCVVSKAGTFYSKRLQYKDGSYYGFKVLFESEAHLKKNTVYRIEALISGPRSGAGNGGLSTVVWSGVTFTFSSQNEFLGGNGTSETGGQFPEFLFSIQ